MFRSSWKGKVRIAIVCLLIVISFCFAMFQGGFVSWFILYSMLPVMCYVIGLSLYKRTRIEASISTDQTQYVYGETSIITVKLRRSFPFPVWSMRMQLEDNNGTIIQTNMYLSWFKNELTCTLRLPSLMRGEYILDHLLLAVSDPFGIVTYYQHIHANEGKFMVFPRLVTLPVQSYESMSTSGMLLTRQSREQDLSVVTGIRDYQAGDRFSIIDWKSTARKNKMQTKEFDQKQSRDVVVVLNANPSMLLEDKVSFTASLIEIIANQKGQVGFWTNGVDETIFPVASGQRQKLKIMDALARVKADYTGSFLPSLLHTMLSFQRNNTVIIVTDVVTEEVIAAFRASPSQQKSVVLFVVKQDAKLTAAEKKWQEGARYSGITVNFVMLPPLESLTGVKAI